MNDSNINKVKEIFSQNPKYAKYFSEEEKVSTNNKENTKNIESKTIISSNNNAKKLFPEPIEQKNKLEEEKLLDQKFIKLRMLSPQVLADYEVEKHMQNLRDIAEYNRWSLKLIQKWLTDFYTSN
jgi:hypothetical protein